MSSVVITEEMKSKAEMYHGDRVGQEKTQLLLKEVGLPNNLLPLKDILECGYIEETGFVWLKQKKKVNYLYKKIGRPVVFATEISGYVEKGKVKKVSGIKTKEMMIWVSLSEIIVDHPSTGKLTFRTPSGLSRVFPSSAFQTDENLLANS